MKLKQSLLTEIKAKGYISYGDACNFISKEGYRVSYGERLLRALSEEKLIKKEYKISKRNKEYVSGYYIGERKEPTIKYIPITYPDGTTAVRQVAE